MTATFDVARDEIQTLFNNYWTAHTPALNGGTPILVEWPGVDAGVPPSPTAPWARITIQHGDSMNQTLSPVGSGQITRTGLVTVQVFAPLSSGGGLSLAEKLGMIARSAFERRSTASGVWFRNARIQEVGLSNSWYQMNAMVQFEYDELN